MKITKYKMEFNRCYRDAVCTWMYFDDGLLTVIEVYNILDELFDSMIEGEVVP